MVPPELAAVIERAIADDLDETGALVDDLIGEITDNGGSDSAAPDSPNAQNPVHQFFDNIGKTVNAFTKFINGVKKLF